MSFINNSKRVPGSKKILLLLLCTLVISSCVGCISDQTTECYVYSEDPSKELYLTGYNDFILVGPSGFSGTYIIDENRVYLGTDYTQITLVRLDNGTLVDTDGEYWYRK